MPGAPHARAGARRRAGLAVALDLVVVLAFVGIGRHAHGHGLTVAGMASTTWPFAAGMAAGWVLAARRRWDLAGPAAGVAVWLGTVALGMVLRVLAGQGTAVSFILVALAFIGLFVLGWRAVVGRRALAGRLRADRRRRPLGAGR